MADKFLNGSFEDEIKYGRCLRTVAHMFPELNATGEESSTMQEVRKRTEIILAAAQTDPSIAKKIYDMSLENKPYTSQQFHRDALYLWKKHYRMKSCNTSSPLDSPDSAKVKQEDSCP